MELSEEEEEGMLLRLAAFSSGSHKKPSQTRAPQGCLVLNGTSHPLLGILGSSHFIAGEIE